MSLVVSPSVGQQTRHKDMFASAKLSREEIGQIVSALEQLAYDTPDSWNKELRVRRIDLGTNPGIVLQGTNLLCGRTGNCQIFVFRKVKGKWVSLFEHRAPIGEAFELGPGTANGVKDFRVIANSSAKSVERIVFKFDGNFYRRK